jgi:hypothetical protein
MKATDLLLIGLGMAGCYALAWLSPRLFYAMAFCATLALVVLCL